MKKTIGAFEKVCFPELGISDMVAKIDTGAFSGALHATNIEEVKKADGSPELVFHPLGDSELEVRTTLYHKKRVRVSNGHLEERYIIDTIIKIAGEEYALTISLSDRHNMMKSVLIGRQFLRRYHFLVDVKQGTKYRYHVDKS